MDVLVFAREHAPQITATLGVVTYAVFRNKLTAGGTMAGVLAGVIHMLHPWSAFFWLVPIFFGLGTLVTKIGHEAKAHLTHSSTGDAGGEGPRTSAQVLANVGLASILVAAHAYLLNSTPFISSSLPMAPGLYSPTLSRLLPIGIVTQYAAVAADTFSSELGILAERPPFLITAPWKTVPRGTNGGVTWEGLWYGGLGSFLLTIVARVALYFTWPGHVMSSKTAAVITGMGLLGSIIDSLLGAILQATALDKRTGKVIEGHGGQRVRVTEGGSRTQTGLDLLTNNGVNFAMATITSVLAMTTAHILGLDIGLSRN